MVNLPAIIAGVVVIAAGVIKWRAYEKPNALQLAALHAGIAALALIWAWRKIGKPARVGPRPGWAEWLRPEVLLAGYAALCALSFLWARLPRLAGVGASAIAPNALWALLVADLTRRRQSRLLLLTLVALAGVVLGGATLWDVADGMDIRQRQGHYNILAAFVLGTLFAGVGAGVAWSLRRDAGRARWPGVAAAALSILTAVWLLPRARSNGAWIGLAVGAAFVALAFVPRRLRWGLILAVGLAFGVGVLALRVSPGVTDRLARRLYRTQQATRLFHLQGAADMVARRPFFGWGTGNFMAAFPAFKPPAAAVHGWGTAPTLHPHSEWVMVAVETGLLGLLLYVGALVGAVLGALRAADRSRGWERWAIAASLGGLTALATHGMATVALRFWGPMTLYWTLFGLTLSTARGDEAPGRLRRRTRQTAAWLAVGAALLMLLTISLPGQRAHYLMGSAEDLAGRPEAAAERLRIYGQALPLSRYEPQYVLALAMPAKLLTGPANRDPAIAAYGRLDRDAPGIGQLRNPYGRLLLRRAQETGNEADRRRGLDLLLDYSRRRPDILDGQIYQGYGLLSGSRANAGRVEAKMRAGVALHPYRAAGHDLLGEALALQGRFAEADKAFGKAVHLLQRKYARALTQAETDKRHRAKAQSLRYRLAGVTLKWARTASALSRNAEARKRIEQALPLLSGFPVLKRQADALAASLNRRKTDARNSPRRRGDAENGNDTTTH